LPEPSLPEFAGSGKPARTPVSVSETQIAGIASAIIARSDYGLTIPSVPNVANVEEEVELYIDFVANAT
jgi:hypothetical protein